MNYRDLYVVVKHTDRMYCVVCYSHDEAIRWINNDFDKEWEGYKAKLDKIDVEHSDYNLMEIYRVISPYSHSVLSTYHVYLKSIDVERLILFS